MAVQFNGAGVSAINYGGVSYKRAFADGVQVLTDFSAQWSVVGGGISYYVGANSGQAWTVSGSLIKFHAVNNQGVGDWITAHADGTFSGSSIFAVGVTTSGNTLIWYNNNPVNGTLIFEIGVGFSGNSYNSNQYTGSQGIYADANHDLYTYLISTESKPHIRLT